MVPTWFFASEPLILLDFPQQISEIIDFFSFNVSAYRLIKRKVQRMSRRDVNQHPNNSIGINRNNRRMKLFEMAVPKRKRQQNHRFRFQKSFQSQYFGLQQIPTVISQPKQKLTIVNAWNRRNHANQMRANMCRC